MLSTVVDHPGEVHFVRYTVGARRDYRRAVRFGLTEGEAAVAAGIEEGQVAATGAEDGWLNALEDTDKRIFWGALAILDRKQTTVNALLALQPGCDVDELDPQLYDLVIDAVTAHVVPKKSLSPSPEKSEATSATAG